MSEKQAQGALPEFGDLAPIDEVLEKISGWEEEDRKRRPGNDPTVHALSEVRRWLKDAIAQSRAGVPVLTPAQLAEIEGVTPSAIYKRLARGRLPGATKRQGGRVVIRTQQDQAA